MRTDRNRQTGLLRQAVYGLAAIGMLAIPQGSAKAANFFEKNFWLSGPNYSGDVPACDTPSALSRIQSQFSTTESRFWNSSLKIDSFDRVREVAFRPWGEEAIPRRFCSADVVVSGIEGTPTFTSEGAYGSGQYKAGQPSAKTVTPRRHKVWYSIVEDGGFIGFSWGVDWCVEGLDRSWTYVPNCRMARP